MSLVIKDEDFKNILLKDGIINDLEFEETLKEAKRMNQSVGNILISKNKIQDSYYKNILSQYFHIPLINLLGVELDENIIKKLPESIARQKNSIIFKQEEGYYFVAMLDPTNLEDIQFLESYLKSKIKPFLSSKESLNAGFSIYNKSLAENFQKEIENSLKESVLNNSKKDQDKTDVPIVSLVDNIISYAISLRASDIHIEVLRDFILIRFRIDGLLREIIRIPKEIHSAIVARFKLMGGLKLDEHNKPQDGRFRYKISGEYMDIRLAIMPTFYGEKVEMRLLSATERPLSLDELGFLDDHKAIIESAIKKTYGMILMTGPTGSGKTTTMYSILNLLNKTEVNIVTIEDPVEYDMKYINQTQINPQSGITFASGLREIVRQDPNIIMVGEIRDEETADISVQAALTGHLVVSSLHTNDAPTAVPRFVDLNVPAFLLSAVLNLVEAQRLVRRICKECVASFIPDSTYISSLEKQFISVGYNVSRIPKNMYKGKGCPACHNTGYKGRIGIFELLEVDEELRQIIMSPNFSLDFLRKTAKEKGMLSMFEDGLRKVELGMTTMEEVLRVIRE